MALLHLLMRVHCLCDDNSDAGVQISGCSRHAESGRWECVAWGVSQRSASECRTVATMGSRSFVDQVLPLPNPLCCQCIKYQVSWWAVEHVLLLLLSLSVRRRSKMFCNLTAKSNACNAKYSLKYIFCSGCIFFSGSVACNFVLLNFEFYYLHRCLAIREGIVSLGIRLSHCHFVCMSAALVSTVKVMQS